MRKESCTGFICALVLVTITAGCATLGRAPLAVTTSCSPKQAWEAALAGVSELVVSTQDKDDGAIVTDWAIMASDQAAGVFQRTANRERARFLLDVTPAGETATISVRQIREYFSPMGVQSQSTKWRRIPAMAEEERRVMQRVSNELKERGCAILN